MPSMRISSTGSTWLPTTYQTRHRRILRLMDLKHSLLLPFLLAIVLFSRVSKSTINLIYCSSDNTGQDNPSFNDTYQSDGACYNYCVQDYAFAIVLSNECWCSNFPPSQQVDLSQCSDPCPGYPPDRCGNQQLGYYNYIELPSHEPSSTTDIFSSATLGLLNISSISTDAPTATFIATPLVSVTTILGSQKTITITPAGAGGPTTTSLPENSGSRSNFFADTSRVAGVFVGIFLALVALVLLFLWLRRRNSQKRNSFKNSRSNPEMGVSGDASPTLGTGSASPTNRPRSTSTLGLVGAYNQEKGTIITSGFAETERITDQRLDPQIWMRLDNDNSSRISLRSLQDNHDYSRKVLKLMNPDE